MLTKKLTGYPSIDKPWLKYYSEEALNAKLPACTIYDYLYESNKDYRGRTALNYFGRKITYGELFENIEKAARALKQRKYRHSADANLAGNCIFVLRAWKNRRDWEYGRPANQRRGHS